MDLNKFKPAKKKGGAKKRPSKVSKRKNTKGKPAKFKAPEPMFFGGVLYSREAHQKIIEDQQRRTVYNRWGDSTFVDTTDKGEKLTNLKQVMKDWGFSSFKEYYTALFAEDEDFDDYIASTLNKNLWAWTNAVNALSFRSTQIHSSDVVDKSNRLQVVPLNTIFLGCQKSPKVFEHLIKLHLPKIATAMQTLGRSGRIPGNVRVVFEFPKTKKLPKPASLHNFNKCIGYPDSRLNGTGIIVHALKETEGSTTVFDYGRECLILMPDKETYFEEAKELYDSGFKLLPKFSWLKGEHTNFKSLVDSRDYKLYKKSWGYTKPIVLFPKNKIKKNTLSIITPQMDIVSF